MADAHLECELKRNNGQEDRESGVSSGNDSRGLESNATGVTIDTGEEALREETTQQGNFDSKAPLVWEQEEEFYTGGSRHGPMIPWGRGVFWPHLKNLMSGCLSHWFCQGSEINKARKYYKDAVCAFVVACTLLPETVGFALMAKFPGSAGAHSSWIIGFLGSAMGGRPGIICAPTGGTASLIATMLDRKCRWEGSSHICHTSGHETLFVAQLFAAAGLFFLAVLRLTRLISLIPTPIKLGFCNGVALIVAKAQIALLMETKPNPLVMALTAVEVLASVIIMLWANRIPRIGHYIPSALAALGVVTVIEHLLVRIALAKTLGIPNLETPALGEIAQFTTRDMFPNVVFLDVSLDWSRIVWWDAASQGYLIMTLVALETLMVSHILDDLSGIPGNMDQQLAAIALANGVSALCGGMPGAGLLGLTLMNRRSGGTGKESGVLAATLVFIAMVGAYRVLNYVPNAALVGIMIAVAGHTFKWFTIPMLALTFVPQKIRSLHPKLQRKIKRFDMFLVFLVTLLCVCDNVVTAVGLGAVLAALEYAWESRRRFGIVCKYVGQPAETKYYELDGPVFFGSTDKFKDCFDIDSDPRHVILVFTGRSAIFDYSALEAICQLKRKYNEKGKTMEIQGLTHSCIRMVAKANHLMQTTDADLIPVEVQPVPPFYGYWSTNGQDSVHQFEATA